MSSKSQWYSEYSVGGIKKKLQPAGEKAKSGVMYAYIGSKQTIPPDDAEADEKTKLHLNMYPEEARMLQDTAAYINGVARDASKRGFIPVGHIALDEENPHPKDIELDLPSEGVFWIKTLYVTHALQRKGIGRAALDEIETMAVKEPLLAKILMLDTVHQDDQRKKELAELLYGGIPKFTNQEWYARRGYRLVKTVQGYYQPDKTLKFWDTRAAFMRKDIE